MNKINKIQVLDRFKQIKEFAPDKITDFYRFDDRKWLEALDTLFEFWFNDTNKGKYNYVRLANGREIEYNNKQIVQTLIDADNPELAYYIGESLSYAMDGNDMEEYLTYLIAKSDYAKIFEKSGLSLLLGIKDENVFEDYVERTIVSLGIMRMFTSNSDNGFNEKTVLVS